MADRRVSRGPLCSPCHRYLCTGIRANAARIESKIKGGCFTIAFQSSTKDAYVPVHRVLHHRALGSAAPTATFAITLSTNGFFLPFSISSIRNTFVSSVRVTESVYPTENCLLVTSGIHIPGWITFRKNTTCVRPVETDAENIRNEED